MLNKHILTLTSNYNKSMIPAIIFGEYGWDFIFVDTKSNTCVADRTILNAWLKSNHITVQEFTNHCWNEYYSMKECGKKFGLISYFEKDDEKIYNYSKTVDIPASYEEI